MINCLVSDVDPDQHHRQVFSTTQPYFLILLLLFLDCLVACIPILAFWPGHRIYSQQASNGLLFLAICVLLLLVHS